MKCPQCANILQQVERAGVVVDVCQNGCGGIWFDLLEIKKFDEPHEAEGADLLDLTAKTNVVVDTSKKYQCPKCDNVKMMRHFFSVKKQVEVDECPECGGIWLDAGELGEIRTQFNTEEERKKAADAYFNDVFAEDYSKMKSANDEQLAKAKKISNMFRFICPSYYMPGKQDGGAF